MPRLTAWLLLVRSIAVLAKPGTATARCAAGGVYTVAHPQSVLPKVTQAAARGAGRGTTYMARGHDRAGRGAMAGAGRGTWRQIRFVEFYGTPAPPGFEVVTAPYVAPDHAGLRFIARNIRDGQVVDWDLPIRAPEITYTLSGPTMIRGSIAPENLDVVEERIDAWATWIDVELAGEIRASGIVGPVAIEGDEFFIEAVGVAGYPTGIPFEGELSVINTDALDVVRSIWAHLLSFPDSVALAVEVSANRCGVLLGTPETSVPAEGGAGEQTYVVTKVTNPAADDPQAQAADLIAARIRSGATTGGINVTPGLTWPGCPAVVTEQAPGLITLYNANVSPNFVHPAGLASMVNWLDGFAAHTLDAAHPTISAAKLIVARVRSGASTAGVTVYPDLTWPGCAPEVTRYHDALIDAYEVTTGIFQFPAGLDDIVAWLDGYASRGLTQERARIDAAEAIEARLRTGVKTNGVNTYEDLTWPGCPAEVSAYGDELIDLYEASTGLAYVFSGGTFGVQMWMDGYANYVGVEREVAETEMDVDDARPYELNWWSDVDCGSEIDSLAASVPFDYTEYAVWNDDRTAVRHLIDLGHPRAGRLRDDLRFAHGENLIEAIVVREAPEVYASQVVVRGSGEGRAAVRGTAGTSDERRVRRVALVTEKSIVTMDRARSFAANELRRRAALHAVGEVVIADEHPNAPMGSFTVGDDIIIDTPISYLGDLRITHRITAYTWSPDAGTVTLQLARSDAFVYGRPGEG